MKDGALITTPIVALAIVALLVKGCGTSDPNRELISSTCRLAGVSSSTNFNVGQCVSDIEAVDQDRQPAVCQTLQTLSSSGPRTTNATVKYAISLDATLDNPH